MHCPKCGHAESKVLETRMSKDNRSLRRRRECQKCEHRFTTIEEIFREDLVVIKRDGTRQDFDRQKIQRGVARATEKRPIPAEKVNTLVTEVVDSIQNQFDSEVPGSAIGEEIMTRLKALDHIAYVRFACVYRDFENIDDLSRAIKELKSKK
jgi:transcriptional repressor NrdR